MATGNSDVSGASMVDVREVNGSDAAGDLASSDYCIDSIEPVVVTEVVIDDFDRDVASASYALATSGGSS